ncbi:hypothetical protein BGW41_005119 [Actinomortierella wolfii]|nr:hypothetical protein BGW41_005119 [Actinomortierella wolfii]
MDCNYCPVCSKHFHSDSQSSLYCSDACRKADALACCAFHECQHPDVSEAHDHLTFCHHHRPAIRIPFVPAIPVSAAPRLQQQQHHHHHHQQLQQDQVQDGWIVFFQNQFHQHHAYSHQHHHHTQPPRHDADVAHRGFFPAGTSSSSSSTAPSNCPAVALKGSSTASHHTNHSFLGSRLAHSSPSLGLLPSRQQMSAVVDPAKLSLPNSTGTATAPLLHCVAAVTRSGQSQGQGQGHDQDQSRFQAQNQNLTANQTTASWLANGSRSHHVQQQALSRWPGDLGLTGDPVDGQLPWTWKDSARKNDRNMESPVSSPTLQLHPSDALPLDSAFCDTPCVIRKHKALPPPTLSPILPPVISDPASLASGSDSGSDTSSDCSSLESAWLTDVSSETDCNGWPRMDRYYFPDHCCRTSKCHSKTAASTAAAKSVTKHTKESGHTQVPSSNSSSIGVENDDLDVPTITLPSLPPSAEERRKSFGSELPPPVKACQLMKGSGQGCSYRSPLSALSDSIWGVGWHQVQPLPPCFVACMQDGKCGATKGSGAKGGSAKGEGHHHHCKKSSSSSSCKAAGAQGIAGGAGSNRKSSNKKSNKNIKAAAEASSPAKTLLAATACRLPRSLQFID